MDNTGLDPIQFGRNSAEIPLILIHDGGGTTFSYYCLGDLERPLYGIANPRFRSGEAWPSVLFMAKCYTEMIRGRVRPGPIILGGWSMGGLLSLEITRILSHDPQYEVAGLVLIDSIFPTFTGMGTRDVDQMTFDERTKPEIRELVKQCMRNSIKIVREWKPPLVDSLRQPNPLQVEEPENDDSSGSERDMYKPARDSTGPRKPYTVLLRAKEIFHVKLSEEQGETASPLVDVHRNKRTLGWDEKRPGLVDEALDVPGHHFSIFLWDNIHAVTEQIRNACALIERHIDHREDGP